jgi:hypothetical protein
VSDKDFYNSFEKIPSPAVFVYTLPNIVIGEISIRFGFKGENRLYLCNSFSKEELFERVNLLKSNMDFKNCLCGFIDVKGDNDFYAEMYLVSDCQ